MKNKFYKILTLTVIAILSLALFAACDKGETEREYDYLVTFNYNVGNLADATAYGNQYLGVMSGKTVALKPGENDNFKEAVISGYFIEGWYTAKLNEDGTPVVGADNRVEFDKKWDFDTHTVSSDITLYANFVQQAKLVVKDAVDGSVVKEYVGKPDDVRRKPSSALQPKKDGWTFVEYYVDQEMTTVFNWPYTYVAGEKVIYGRFLEGEWALVDTPEKFTTALGGNKNIYLLNDLDFTGKKWGSMSYNSEINGNGFKLSNITAELEYSQRNSVNLALFGALGENANLHNFTIENANVSVVWARQAINCNVALFVWKAEAGATIKNVVVSGTLRKGTLPEGSDAPEDVFKSAIAIGESNATIENCDFSGIQIID